MKTLEIKNKIYHEAVILNLQYIDYIIFESKTARVKSTQDVSSNILRRLDPHCYSLPVYFYNS